MSAMLHLHALCRLGRLALAWFALTLGVAIAAPLVAPGSYQLVCSAGGSVKLAVDGDRASAGPTLDCPLCLVAGAPPPAIVAAVIAPGTPEALTESAHPSHHGLRPVQNWQARAPPVV